MLLKCFSEIFLCFLWTFIFSSTSLLLGRFIQFLVAFFRRFLHADVFAFLAIISFWRNRTFLWFPFFSIWRFRTFLRLCFFIHILFYTFKRLFFIGIRRFWSLLWLSFLIDSWFWALLRFNFVINRWLWTFFLLSIFHNCRFWVFLRFCIFFDRRLWAFLRFSIFPGLRFWAFLGLSIFQDWRFWAFLGLSIFHDWRHRTFLRFYFLIYLWFLAFSRIWAFFIDDFSSLRFWSPSALRCVFFFRFCFLIFGLIFRFLRQNIFQLFFFRHFSPSLFCELTSFLRTEMFPF